MWFGYLGGKPSSEKGTIAFTFPEGKQPNRFNRWMQYLVLGIYWVKK